MACARQRKRVPVNCASRIIPLLTRREFLYANVLFFALQLNARARRVRLAAFVPGDAPPALRGGLAFGSDEAAHTAALFGVTLTCDIVPWDPSPSGAVPPTLGSGIDAAICAAPGPAGTALLAALAERDIVVVDVVGAGPVPLAGAAPSRRIFRLWPALPDGATERVELWHPTLHRYGAEQLNERYARRAGTPMTSAAWAGWFAVKVLSEVMLRRADRPAGGDALSAVIARGGFDGHKGTPLSFDAATGVLRQPLYSVGSNGAGEETVLREIPPERAW